MHFLTDQFVYLLLLTKEYTQCDDVTDKAQEVGWGWLPVDDID